MPGGPQKPKWAATTITKLTQKLEKLSTTNENNTLAPFPRIPSMANEGFLDCNDRNMEGIGVRTQGWENF